MNKWQQMVREFHENSGATINDKPTILSDKDQILRVKLIEEEGKELAFDAFGWQEVYANAGKVIGFTKGKSMDLVETADAIGDLLYVVLGTAVSCGIDIEPVFAEIHRSNMTKFIDGHRREDGKWIKGPSYEPANLKPIIDAQSNVLSN